MNRIIIFLIQLIIYSLLIWNYQIGDVYLQSTKGCWFVGIFLPVIFFITALFFRKKDIGWKEWWIFLPTILFVSLLNLIVGLVIALWLLCYAYERELKRLIGIKDKSDFIAEQLQFIRHLWDNLPNSHRVAFAYIWLHHHQNFYRVFAGGKRWYDPEMFHAGLALLEDAAFHGVSPIQISDFMHEYSKQAALADNEKDVDWLTVFSGKFLFHVMEYFQSPTDEKLADFLLFDRPYDDLVSEANDAEINIPFDDPQDIMDQRMVDFLKELGSFPELPVDWQTRFVHYGEPLVDLQKVKKALDNAYADTGTEAKK